MLCEETFCGRKHIVEKTFFKGNILYRKRFVLEIICWETFVWKHFVEEAFSCLNVMLGNVLLFKCNVRKRFVVQDARFISHNVQLNNNVQHNVHIQYKMHKVQ